MTKIIAIEGLDKAGKHTACLALKTYFESKGLSVKTLSFPNDDAPTSVLIRQWLAGTLHADEKTFELLQAADKQYTQSLINDYVALGIDVVLIDRYVHTELAYGAKDNDPAWLLELTKYMRAPDHVVYLNVEPEVSLHRRGKFGDNDRYESDIDRLRFTKGVYEKLFAEHALDSVVHEIDANQPALIVKADVIHLACLLYHAFTGKPVNEKSELTHQITPLEARMIYEWQHPRLPIKEGMK